MSRHVPHDQYLYGLIVDEQYNANTEVPIEFFHSVSENDFMIALMNDNTKLTNEQVNQAIREWKKITNK